MDCGSVSYKSVCSEGMQAVTIVPLKWSILEAATQKQATYEVVRCIHYETSEFQDHPEGLVRLQGNEGPHAAHG